MGQQSNKIQKRARRARYEKRNKATKKTAGAKKSSGPAT